ncbi:hypothetical protein [Elizabethkingia anophelis]|uniref:hypothetical protein n=1 Tax=Elizabethkingia anophelis TaxID=1117645 RepID=UPI0024E1FBFB|nr:hypothetical protein [Elizabethkingia anophelis]MCT4162094.1 hypothetical protein [Elizabethkingia anophelis]CAH1144130.1 hypothetical protein EAVNVB490_01650 [Elizabethkingia anophelis]CAI9670573.1 hypothetical protein EAVNNN508_01649 [Elizabethkingia anophelis]CAI9673151.1 hypothetical protein EAVNVB490_00513 [Elizabethkingia anophelis]CAI9677968.1 hypothetical protein EAVNNN508_00511 [Elizabethkingia anophelis]
MSIYFKTLKTSETGIKAQDLVDRAREIVTNIKLFCKEIGATEIYVTSGYSCLNTGIIAVQFETEPDMKHWKNMKDCEGFYAPRLTSKSGKEIHHKMESFDTILRHDIDEIIGIKEPFRHCGFSITYGDFFGFIIDENWNHTMPSDCKEITYSEYKKL